MPTSGRPSIVLPLVLAIALAAGAAASLLAGAASTTSSASGPAVLVTIPAWVLADVLLGAGAAILGYLIYQRFTGGTVPVPRRPVITVLLVVLMAVIFVVAAHVLLASGTPASGSGSSSGTGNGTSSGSPNGSVNLGQGAGGLLWSPSIPAWLPFVLVAGIALIIVAVAFPRMREAWTGRWARTSRIAAARARPAGVREALEIADRSLSHGDDPRAVIIQLYATLIARLTPMVGSVEADTPEEIRSSHLVRLGIRPDAAEALTRLFEEARYSSHALDAEARERGRRAVAEALADLDRRPTAP